MVCQKCGYKDKFEQKIGDFSFCKICATFAPREEVSLKDYVSEKIDWKDIETFRKYSNEKSKIQKQGMSKVASKGLLVSRAPMGYSLSEGKLNPNEDFSRVHSLFRTFLIRNYSLNSLAKNFGISVNGLKKILTNRTYLGEVKFDGQIYKGQHKPLVSAEIFYAVQRKLKTYLKPRKSNQR